ncbi:hypothetical protein AVEN_256711-1, partial [Araneus ventricosus]
KTLLITIFLIYVEESERKRPCEKFCDSKYFSEQSTLGRIDSVRCVGDRAKRCPASKDAISREQLVAQLAVKLPAPPVVEVF